jgi:hypothetical protein
MPGDYSRKIFDSRKHYSGVLMQQGRVQLDSDWNEQLDIEQHRTHTETKDVIGCCGVPVKSDGFRIEAATGEQDLNISAGRIYVGGLMCELEPPGATYTNQPYYPNPDHTNQIASPLSPPGESLNLDNGTYLVYIDAWQRERTALDDARIREVALGGPDTTARLQTVWQVRLLPLVSSPPLGSPPGEVQCRDQFDEFNAVTAPATGRMNARTNPAEDTGDLCELPPAAGYKRLENQLYRVEVHTGGDRGAATFKWSRDNATVESTIENVDNNIVTVADIGKDDFLGFAGGQWVEIVDEESDLKSPRPLVEIDSIDPNSREVTMKSSVAEFEGIKNAKLRRWDQTGPNANSNAVKMDVAEWVDLEGGIQVRFSAGTYKTHDYWLIPARTATGEIEWPPFEVPNTSPAPQPPAGVQHHYCKLALISVSAQGIDITDCRPLFPPLTELTQLHYVSGDGQEGLPGQQLQHPIQAGVVNGSLPVVDARVRFRIVAGSGTLISGPNSGANIVVQTGQDGVAECRWQLGAVAPGTTTSIHRVEATLLDHDTLPVRFNASLAQRVRVLDEGVFVSERDTLNFIGAGVTASDSVNRVNIVIPGGGRFVETRPTNLLFPFVSRQPPFDTGISIANTSLDPLGAGSLPDQSGTITFFFYPQTGAPFAFTPPAGHVLGPGGVLPAGRTFVMLLSELLRLANPGLTTFTGYIIVVCDFAGAYGYAQISDFQTNSHGYLAIVLPSPRVEYSGTRGSGIGTGRL